MLLIIFKKFRFKYNLNIVYNYTKAKPNNIIDINRNIIIGNSYNTLYIPSYFY